jgi:hypothetical protein
MISGFSITVSQDRQTPAEEGYGLNHNQGINHGRCSSAQRYFGNLIYGHPHRFGSIPNPGCTLPECTLRDYFKKNVVFRHFNLIFKT